jgi:hypothetical protein
MQAIFAALHNFFYPLCGAAKKTAVPEDTAEV